MKKDLIIWGAKGHSIVLNDILSSEFKLLSLIDNNLNQISPILDIPVYYKKEGFKNWLKSYNKPINNLNFIIAIGGTRGFERIELHNYLKDIGVNPINAIHNNACIASSVSKLVGAHILANSTISSNVQIGTSVIVNTASSIDHECIISDGVHIAPGAILTGNIFIGKYSFVGAGTTILPNIRIGENVIIGAGSLVTKDIPSNVMGYGSPFKIVKKI
jgi:sugar O-acyltransferase (sialic acid O-acetyltransferase NeuD family)